MSENGNGTPKTLQEAIIYFAKPGVAVEFMARLRWPDGAFCSNCGLTGDDVYFMESVQRWKCKGCKKQFSVKVGTVMEDSPIKLDKWLCAIWMVANCKNGVSSYEIHRAIGVTQKTAWFLLHRIRLAMTAGGFGAPSFSGSGPFEADETFVGGKLKNKHVAERKAHGGSGNKAGAKAIVMGVLERSKRVRAQVIPNTQAATVQAVVKAEVPQGATLYTDASHAYKGVDGFVAREYVNHVDTYVRGEVHTNGIENFWSLLKRCLRGTYVSVEPFHLGAYVDEQVFRYNERKGTDSTRFETVAGAVGGKRLTYAELTGRTAPVVEG